MNNYKVYTTGEIIDTITKDKDSVAWVLSLFGVNTIILEATPTIY